MLFVSRFPVLSKCQHLLLALVVVKADMMTFFPVCVGFFSWIVFVWRMSQIVAAERKKKDERDLSGVSLGNRMPGFDNKTCWWAKFNIPLLDANNFCNINLCTLYQIIYFNVFWDIFNQFIMFQGWHQGQRFEKLHLYFQYSLKLYQHGIH